MNRREARRELRELGVDPALIAASSDPVALLDEVLVPAEDDVLDVDCGHCERPQDRCSDVQGTRNCYRPQDAL